MPALTRRLVATCHAEDPQDRPAGAWKAARAVSCHRRAVAEAVVGAARVPLCEDHRRALRRDGHVDARADRRNPWTSFRLDARAIRGWE